MALSYTIETGPVGLLECIMISHASEPSHELVLLLGVLCLPPFPFAYPSFYLTFRCQSNGTPSGSLPSSRWPCSILNLSSIALNTSVVHYSLVISLIPSFLLD